MNRFLLAAISGIALALPFSVYAIITPSVSGQTGDWKLVSTNPIIAAQRSDPRPEIVVPPSQCEMGCSMSNAGNCKAGDVTGNPNGDPQCAAARVGYLEYTKLSSFGSSGSCVDKEDNNRCASGSCTTWQGQPVYGVAHRTFPFGTRMEVCNLSNGVCQIATVIERGPHSAIGSVTVDARVELASALLMGCNNTTQATYRILSVPGISQTAEPSGPAKVAFDALLAAGHINGNLGNNQGNPNGYSMVNTPYGPGYLGNPTTRPYYAMQPTGGSPYASASPSPIQSGQTGTPVSQQLGTQAISPYSSLTSNTSATNLQNALNPTPAQTATTPPSQTVVPGAPSVASIYIQPHVASRTGSILISWTSLNMKPGTCTVKQDAQQIAVAQEGSKSIAGSSVSTGTITFTLSCTAQDGSAVAKTDTITVQ